MLQELRISNLAIIERSELHCGAGLNVLTGETGAGKSVLIKALGLLVGERAASEQVGEGAATPENGRGGSRALVEGAFDLRDAPQAARYLCEHELTSDDLQLIVAREVSADGRSRVRLNGRLATIGTLRELGDLLVDIHGQHEHQLLLRPDTHLGFLDGYGDGAHQELRLQTRERFGAWRAAARQLDELTGSEAQRAQRLDTLQFQIDEIDAAKLEADEDTLLSDERMRLMHAEKLRAAAAACRDALQGGEEPGALSLLQQASKAAQEILEVDGSVATWLDELQSAVYAVEDAAREASSYADRLEADPARLEVVEARLQRLNRLKRKYGGSLAQVLAHRGEAGAEIDRLGVSERELDALREAAEALHQQYAESATKLSQARRDLAGAFAQAVVGHLRSLAMERARFEVGFAPDAPEGAEGIDRVEFLLSANAGQPPRPLARIASGGEISRVMLALRCVLARSLDADAPRGRDISGGTVPTLVFDEIDVGIGGVTAEAVGEKMQELARHFQIFCVTHLPQIARRADHHYLVHKESDEARTRVSVTPLEGEERVRELARMMGRDSQANLRHARELLESK